MGATIVLLLTWSAGKEPPARVLRDASVDVLAVALIGTLGSLVVGRMQRDAEQRHRVDERVAEFAQQLVVSYNGAKRIRRMLDAELSLTEPSIDRARYAEHMAALCDHQLEFESLRRRAPVLAAGIGSAPEATVPGKTRSRERTQAIAALGHTGAYAWSTATASWPAESFGLESACAAIEHNLNQLVEEFQHNLVGIPPGAPVHVTELEPPVVKHRRADEAEPQGAMLPVFVWDTDCFRARVTRYVDAALTYLDGRLLGVATRK